MQSFNIKRLFDNIWLYKQGIGWNTVYVLKQTELYKNKRWNYIDVCWLDLSKSYKELGHSSIYLLLDELNEDHWCPMPALEALLYQEQIKYILQVEAAKERDLRNAILNEEEEK